MDDLLGPIKFAFESEAWERVIAETIELTAVYRQKDAAFVQLLNCVRHGIVTPAHVDVLSERLMIGQHVERNGIVFEPTRLYPLNEDVDRTNEQRLRKLPGIARTYKASDEGLEQHRTLLQNTPAPETLVLKVGAQVILLYNVNVGRGLASGVQGVVVGFDESRSSYPRVKFLNGVVETIAPESWPVVLDGVDVAVRTQVPLKLSWALSVHKCQGQTLAYAQVDLGKTFEVPHLALGVLPLTR